MKQRPVTTRRKRTQSGFILLVIFMMAGAIALMLYAQLPRVAFESEREKEQVLIDRGEQFIRAIKMYQLDNAQQWPQSLDDLEKHNNKRYLRRRYVDPYTGKNEWRLIHTNGGQLTDSLVTKPPGEDSKQADANAQPQEPQINAAAQLRPSDLTLPGTQTFFVTSPNPQPQGQPQTGVAGQPQFPGQPGFGVPGAGLPNGVQLPGNVQSKGATPQFPGQQLPGQLQPPGAQTNPGGFQPQFPGQQFPGQQPIPGTQVNVPPGFQMGPNGQIVPIPIGNPQTVGGLTGANTGTTPGFAGGGANAGIDAINRILTTPRTPPAGVGAPQNNAVGGGGIAGVASTHTGPSIKVYKERSKYEEWEFVYTPQQGGFGPGQPQLQPPPPGGPPPSPPPTRR